MLYWCGWIVSYLGTFDGGTDIRLVRLRLVERSFISLSARDLLQTLQGGWRGELGPCFFFFVFFLFLMTNVEIKVQSLAAAIIAPLGTVASDGLI